MAEWSLGEVVDVAFHPAARKVGGKVVSKEHLWGEIRISTNWHEQRKGISTNADDDVMGIYFDVRSEAEALRLFNHIRSHPALPKHKSPYIAQVETEKFALSLDEKFLIVTRRLYAKTFKQRLDTALTNAAVLGETKLPLATVVGVNFQPAHSDKLIMGKFNGHITILTTGQGGTWSVLGATRNELEFDFPKSSEAKVRDFIAVLEERLEAPPSANGTGPTNSQLSISDELSKLAQLYQDGVLSNEEFATAKSKLLDG